MKTSKIIRTFTRIKILPVKGLVKGDVIETALTDYRFIAFMAIYMAALGTYIAAGYIFNPTTPTKFSVKLVADQAFRYIGLGAGFLMPAILAFSAVRIGNEAMGGDSKVNCKVMAGLVLIIFCYHVGLVMIHMPLFDANYNYFLLSVVPLVVLVFLNLIKYFMIFTSMHIWVVDLQSECKAALSEDLLDINDVQKILERYRRLQLGLARPSLLVFLATQICVIMSIFIFITGETYFNYIYL